MPQYQYTDAFERVFSDLSHGPGVRVIRGGEPLAVPDDAAGSTVVLIAGDVLDTDEPLPFTHAFLTEVAAAEPADTPTAEPARASRKRATADTTDPGTDGGDLPPAA